MWRACWILLFLLPLHKVTLGRSTEGFRHPLLDHVYGALRSSQYERNLTVIDSALRDPHAANNDRVTYFLRRVRCEQLYYQGLLDESMMEAEKARRLAQHIGDSLLLASSFNQIAVLREEHHDAAGAIGLLSLALKWYPASDRSEYPLARPYRIHGNLGLCWADLGLIDRATFHQQRSLELATQDDAPRGRALALLELARLALFTGDHDRALLLTDSSRAIATRHDVDDVALESLELRAEVDLQRGDPDGSRRDLDVANALLARSPHIAQRSVIAFLDGRTRLLNSMGLHTQALASAREWQRLDSATRVYEARSAQASLSAVHATDAALAEAQRTQRATQLEHAMEHRTRTIIAIGGGGALLLLTGLVIALVGRARQRVRLTALELQQAEQDREITELRVRQQVREDLHDDLGAGLSALKLHAEMAADLGNEQHARQSGRTSAQLAGDLIDNLRHLLWSLDNDDNTARDLANYLENMARGLCTRAERPIHVTLEGEWPMLELEADTRHLAWSILKDGLNIVLREESDVPLRAVIAWNDGIVLQLSAETDDPDPIRKQWAARMSQHQLAILRVNGSVRVSQDGPLALVLHLPVRPTSGMSKKVTTGILALFLCSLSVSAQESYHHRVLDDLFDKSVGTADMTGQLERLNKLINTHGDAEDPMLECHLRLSRANQMYYRGFFDRGLNDVNRTLHLAERLGDSLLMSTAYNMMGLLHENVGDPAVTLSWFNKAAAWLPRDARSPYPVVKPYHIDANRAQCLFMLGRMAEAEPTFLRSMDLALAEGNLRAAALAELGSARCAAYHHDQQRALDLLHSAGTHAARPGSWDVLLDVLVERAKINGPAPGRAILDSALAFADVHEGITATSRSNAYRWAYQLLDNWGHEQNALLAWSEWRSMDSTMRAQDDRASLELLELMLDNDQHLADQQADMELRKNEVKALRAQRQVLTASIGVGTVLILAIGLVITGRYRNRTRLALLETERAKGRAELEELRTRQRLSEELHQDLGIGLEALKLRSTLALELGTDLTDHERSLIIAQRSDELLTSLDQIVWALDTENATIRETMLFTVDHAQRYCDQQALSLQLHCAERWPAGSLTVEQRRAIFLVVKEALHNIVKHAGAAEVYLRMAYRDGITVEIADNGKGLAPGYRSGNGLRNMQKRITAVGGTFTVDGSNGTRITFWLPLRT